MNDIYINLKMKADALQRCIGFVADGYLLQKQYTWSDAWTFWLVHKGNKKKILITWTERGVIVRKNGKMIFMKGREEYQ